jgi:hypothetical protein
MMAAAVVFRPVFRGRLFLGRKRKSRLIISKGSGGFQVDSMKTHIMRYVRFCDYNVAWRKRRWRLPGPFP